MKNHPPVKHARVHVPRVISGDSADVPPGNCKSSVSRDNANRDHDSDSLGCEVDVHFKA